MRSIPAAFSVLLVVSSSLWATYPQFGQAGEFILLPLHLCHGCWIMLTSSFTQPQPIFPMTVSVLALSTGLRKTGIVTRTRW